MRLDPRGLQLGEVALGAQADATAEIRRFLGLHSVTRVGPRGRQEVVSVERLHDAPQTCGKDV